MTDADRNSGTAAAGGFVAAAGRRLEYLWAAPRVAGRPVLVFLHEGLGAAKLWRDFPARLGAATGCGALAWSRYGHGASDVLAEKRDVGYMHDEATAALPALLAALGIERPILVGHSDGASIALIHAGTRRDGAPRWPVTGLILEAPHVFVEDITIAGIEAARTAWRTTDLPQRLGRHHADGERTFWGWNDIWLDPRFRAWNIEEYLAPIAAPILVIQGEDDEYGTKAQVDAIAARACGPVETLMLADCRHSPHRDRPDAVLDAMTAFIGRIVDGAAA
jgi:pimeloyl-ACP methyl ester carboxylesterase